MRCLSILLVLLASPSLAFAAPVNAVAGDLSWQERFGRAPTPDDDARELERIQTHLAWVERELRARSVAHLDEPRRARRKQLLDALADYRRAAVFPRNTEHPGRRPRFVDPDGRTCAVGHLVELTAGRALTEAIAARFEHAYLADIHDPRLDAWIAASGFTARELAMIQPSYGWIHDPRPAPEPEPPRPPMDARSVALTLAALDGAATACLDGADARDAAVFVTQRPDGDRRVSVRTRPRRSDAERCLRDAIQDALVRLRRAQPVRPIHVRRLYRGSPRTERERTAAAVRGLLDARLLRVQACLPPAGARRGDLAVRVRVDADGAVSIARIHLPRARPRLQALAADRPDPDLLRCVTGALEGLRLADPTPTQLTWRVPFAGTWTPALSPVGDARDGT